MSKRPSSKDLWEMPIDEFNQWRAENDIPELFRNFQKVLPDFDDWLEAHDFTLEFLSQPRNPGQFFQGRKEKLLIEFSESEHIDTRYYFAEPINSKAEKEIRKISKQKGDKIKTFLPYPEWGRKRFSKRKFIPAGHAGELETLRYTVGSAPDVPEMCNWYLLGFTVLKLGDYKVPDNKWICGRNLDFTNLDFLEIEGKYHGNSLTPIFFSHAHNMKIKNGQIDFFEFYSCDVSNLELDQSRLYGSYFVEGNLWGLHCKNSKLHSVTFQGVSISNLDLDNCHLDNLEYNPPKREYHTGLSGSYKSFTENYKRLRVAYSKIGNRVESRSCYYLERFYEMKHKMKLVDFSSSFYKIKNFRLIAGVREFGKTVRLILSFLNDFAVYLLWGFGEKPRRIIVNSIVVILIYSAIFYTTSLPTDSEFIESLYLSVFTFVRLGVVDMQEFSNLEKLIIGSEGLFGWVMIVLVISGYANKSKY